VDALSTLWEFLFSLQYSNSWLSLESRVCFSDYMLLLYYKLWNIYLFLKFGIWYKYLLIRDQFQHLLEGTLIELYGPVQHKNWYRENRIRDLKRDTFQKFQYSMTQLLQSGLKKWHGFACFVPLVEFAN
jgi:hypothetical protein